MRFTSAFIMLLPCTCGPTAALRSTQVAQVIATLGEAKLAVNIVTQPEDKSDRRR